MRAMVVAAGGLALFILLLNVSCAVNLANQTVGVEERIEREVPEVRLFVEATGIQGGVVAHPMGLFGETRWWVEVPVCDRYVLTCHAPLSYNSSFLHGSYRLAGRPLVQVTEYMGRGRGYLVHTSLNFDQLISMLNDGISLEDVLSAHGLQCGEAENE